MNETTSHGRTISRHLPCLEAIGTVGSYIGGKGAEPVAFEMYSAVQDEKPQVRSVIRDVTSFNSAPA